MNPEEVHVHLSDSCSRYNYGRYDIGSLEAGIDYGLFEISPKKLCALICLKSRFYNSIMETWKLTQAVGVMMRQAK